MNLVVVGITVQSWDLDALPGGYRGEERRLGTWSRYGVRVCERAGDWGLASRQVLHCHLSQVPIMGEGTPAHCLPHYLPLSLSIPGTGPHVRSME